MKTTELFKALVSLSSSALLIAITGCATAGSNTQHFPTKYRATDGRAIDVGKRSFVDNGWKFDEPHLDQCWVGADFDFSGYDTLYIAPTLSVVGLKNSNEVGPNELAKENLAIELQRMIRAKHIIANVVTRETDIPPGVRALKMENTITRYAKGNEATRFWFGVGQPKLRVAGKIIDGDRTVLTFEGHRSGTSAQAFFNGGYITDVEIQLQDIQSLTTDLTDVMAVVAGKYKPRN